LGAARFVDQLGLVAKLLSHFFRKLRAFGIVDAVIADEVLRRSLHLFFVGGIVAAAVCGVMTSLADYHAIFQRPGPAFGRMLQVMRLYPFAKDVAIVLFAEPIDRNAAHSAKRGLPLQRLLLNSIGKSASLALGQIVNPPAKNTNSWAMKSLFARAGIVDRGEVKVSRPVHGRRV
jgi:hypothetical protein